MSALSDAIETLRPPRGSPDGPLPPLLVALTIVTGLVDATSYLNLGHVFVANMTGNVVFLGFAIAGAKGLSIWASLMALGAFLAGGIAGGRVGVHLAPHRLRLLRAALILQLVAVAAGALLALAGGDPVGGARKFVLIAVLGLAMGVQNATARRLAVAELTTTVLTMTLTGIAADSALAGGKGSKIGRRSLALAAMFLGALVGALLALKLSTFAPLACAAALIAVVAAAAHVCARRDAQLGLSTVTQT